MTKRERTYQKKQQELIDKVGKLEDREVGKVLKILEGTRKEVAANIAKTEWQAYAIPRHKEAIGQAIERFKQKYLASQSDALRNSWNAGIDVVDSPLQFVGIRIAAPEISMSSLEIMQGFSADLIKGLSADVVKKINGEITLGIMGGKQPYDVMKAIGLNLKEKSIFKTIGHRAETIVKTETARVNSSAREARIQGTVGNTDPDMAWEKKWISSGKAHPRDHHAALNGVTVGIDEDFLGYIPYPHAPGLAAEEVVNCGCSHVLTSPDWEKLPKSYEPIEYQERGEYEGLPAKGKQKVKIPEDRRPEYVEPRIAKSTEDADKNMAQFKKSLTAKESANVTGYTKGDYNFYNPDLRKSTLKGDYKKQADLLSDTLKKAPKFEGIVYRNMAFESKNEMENFLSDLRKNKLTTARAFSSTTTDKSALTIFKERFNTEIEIKSKKGVWLDDLASNPVEKEVLFNSDTNFSIKKIRGGKNPKIYLEEI